MFRYTKIAEEERDVFIKEIVSSAENAQNSERILCALFKIKISYLIFTLNL